MMISTVRGSRSATALPPVPPPASRAAQVRPHGDSFERGGSAPVIDDDRTRGLKPPQAKPPTPTTLRFELSGPVTEAQQARLRARFDVEEGPGGLEIYVSPGNRARMESFILRELGIPRERLVLLDRGRPFSEIEETRPKIDAGYFEVPEVNAWMDDLVAKYPDRARKVDLTTLPGAEKTHRGQSIYALKISSDVAHERDVPAVVLASQHHARELNSAVITLHAMKWLLEESETDPNLKAFLDTHEIYVVPTMNPDGVDYVWGSDNWWRKNRRDNGGGTFGVDQNRNYPFLYGTYGASSWPSSQTYKGPEAASEPETKTLMALGEALQPELYLDFHSYGREVLSLYPPNAVVTPQVEAMGNRYANDLRDPMRYDVRPPSASGEAPHQFWSRGTLAFLVEVGTSFQPQYTSAVEEAQRVWPGVKKALLEWSPAARGHVRDSVGNPVEAQITVTPNPFRHGELSRSRERDGRYSLWVPPGEYQVTFQAPGYAPVTKSLSVTEYDQGVDLEVVLEASR